ncbi:septation protein IspZ [Candidatus Gracilibacteria bacterium]|nr:septation protein IspZ [Candidatus Gracilibacteria bacterium]
MNIFSNFTPKILRHLFLAVLLEFGPVLIFLMAFERYDVYKATIILMIATIISTIATFRIQKRLPYLALYVALITAIFGYVTLALHQPKFIQIRDTLYDLTLALTLVTGLMINVSFLKLSFHKVIPMTTRAWTNLTHSWIGFFISIAVANEYARRVLSLGEWFYFKSIMVLVTVVFGCVTLYFLYEKGDE